jgi:hypothetical protein
MRECHRVLSPRDVIQGCTRVSRVEQKKKRGRWRRGQAASLTRLGLRGVPLPLSLSPSCSTVKRSKPTFSGGPDQRSHSYSTVEQRQIFRSGFRANTEMRFHHLAVSEKWRRGPQAGPTKNIFAHHYAPAFGPLENFGPVQKPHSSRLIFTTNYSTVYRYF